MTTEEFYRVLKQRFEQVLADNGIGDEAVRVTCRALSPEEAIGNTARRDFPILTGKDVMIQAEFRGFRGQAFTDAPLEFRGSLADVLAMDLERDPHARGLYIAVLNAVMCSLGKCQGTVHCRTEGPELCAKDMHAWLREHYPDRKKIALIGYQPALLEMLANSICQVRVLDLNPANVGTVRYGVLVEDGVRDYEAVVNGFADLILCTGSTICNGTIVNYIGLDTEVVFFGTTISGSAGLMGLKRACFADRYA
ncbi:MAG: Rossmann-like domain-containing protein [Oscillospiraceae bacterium]